MQLLIEEAIVLEAFVQEDKSEKNYYIQGIFSTPDKENRNGRIYSAKLWENNVNLYQEHIKNNTINTLGELEHPSRVQPDPMLAVMKIVELKMEDGLVKGKAKILNNNSPQTNQIKALIDEGIKIGVSSRGTGKMNGKIVEEFSLSCYDLVSQPSDYNANLNGIRESVETEVVLNESTGKYVCSGEECFLKSQNQEIQEELIEGTGSGDIAQDSIKNTVQTKSNCIELAEQLLKNLKSYIKEDTLTEKTEQEILAAELIEKYKGNI